EGLIHGMSAYESVVTMDSPIPGVAPMEVMYRIEPGDLSFNDKGAVLSLRMGVGANKGTDHPSPGSLVLGSCDVSKGLNEALCCGTAPGAGCVQDTCEACVCAADDYCCTDKWDALCANHAANACDATCGCSDSGAAAMNLDLDKPVEGYLSQDVVNQFLFALWWGGQLDVDLGGDALAGAVDGVNISNLQVNIDPLLPPVVTTCGESGDLELQLGDVLADASFELNGTPASFSLYTSLRVGLDITVIPTPEGGGELAIDPQKISFFDYQLMSTDGLGAIGEIVIDGMMDTLVQQYLVTELLSGLTKAYPIPVVDISPWISGVSSGTKLTLVPQAVTWEPGQLHLGGQIQEP
ncbi:MAG: hypothetical protein VX938_00685, partial [Myxococcota bacterium]|nr:hypothetical protein [Myxococcota bacterium]